MQNITHGTGGVLNDQCVEELGVASRHLCMLSPQLQRHVTAPFFLFTSSYDSWQLRNILGLVCVQSLSPDKTTTLPAEQDCTSGEQDIIEAFNDQFLSEMNELARLRNFQHGAMITSCICHDCPWEELVLDHKSGVQLYVDWYNGVKDSQLNFHVDKGPANGGGKLLKHEHCLEVQLPYVCVSLGGTKTCLTQGAWAGIVVGVIALVVLGTVAIAAVVRRRRPIVTGGDGLVRPADGGDYMPPSYMPVADADFGTRTSAHMETAA